jgi:CDP-4-dehydro-6-deoxyglucose reductase, E1
VLNPDLKIDRERVFAALHDADIQFRIITGGNFLRHDVIQYFDHQIHRGATPNADTAHDNGFFVGNQPFDLSGEIERLHRVLSKAC